MEVTLSQAYDIRPLAPADEPAVVELWNRALGDTFPLRPRLLHQVTLGDPDLQPSDALVAWRQGQVIGFILARTRPGYPLTADQGWVEAIIVDPAHQRQGLGTALLAEAEARFRKQELLGVWAGGGPADLFAGVPLLLPGALSFFERRGYPLTHDTYDLLGDLQTMPHAPRVDHALAAEHAAVRPCAEAERDAAQRFLEENFPGAWADDRRRHRLQGAPAGEIYLLWAQERVIGLAQTYTGDSPALGANVYWAPALGVAEGGLGPIGIAPEWQGRGLGLALLTLALEGLRARGARRAVIDWTNLLDFYGKLGFHVWRAYRQGAKEL